MGVRLFGVRLLMAGRSDLEDLLFGVAVAVACGSFEAGRRSASPGLCGVLAEGSGRAGISGSAGSCAPGDEAAVIQLSSFEFAEVSAVGVGVGCCYM